jgi:EAL domain-containing protein (putative c-di-GMP-specific phosphodiesterase class I)
LQPVVALGSGRLVGAEALARFPDRRPPDVWFREAREAGRGVDLEAYAVRVALTVLPRLPTASCLSVNASPELILDPQFARTLTAAGVPLDRLVVEITEHVPIDRYDDINAALKPLRQLGLRLAIDDAGAGYASFNHVLRLHPDIVKLDRSLVARIDTDPARRALVTAMILIALELGATVTAEGVETDDELRTLAALGVDAAQGYLLARPTLDSTQWATWHARTWPCGSRLADHS